MNPSNLPCFFVMQTHDTATLITSKFIFLIAEFIEGVVGKSCEAKKQRQLVVCLLNLKAKNSLVTLWSKRTYVTYKLLQRFTELWVAANTLSEKLNL